MVELSETVVSGWGIDALTRAPTRYRERADDAVRRRLYDRIGEVVGCIDTLCLGLCKLCLGGEQAVLGSQQIPNFETTFLAKSSFLLS